MMAAAEFWEAVAGNDDEQLLSLLAPTALDRLVGSPPYTGLAGGLRDLLELGPPQIESLGWLDTVGILAGGGFRIRRTAQAEGFYEAGQPLASWPVDVVPGSGDRPWLVDPIRPLPRSEIGTLTIDLGSVKH